MPITYKYNEQTNLVTTKLTGALHSDDILVHLNRLIKDEEIKPNFIELVDFNGAEDLILKYSNLAFITGTANELINKGHRVTLFCAYHEFSQAILGMMVPLFHSVNLNVIACKDKDELEVNLSVFLEKNS